MKLHILGWLLAFFVLPGHGAPKQPLTITRIVPDGLDVPPGRQIAIQFNRPVVPLGRMERTAAEIPITITPALNCEWRWLSTSALACQLGEKDAFRESTRYRLVIRPGIRAEDGATLGAEHRHEFVTRRPDVTYTSFRTWSSPGMPHIRLVFNQPVGGKSVGRHFHLSREGKPRIPLKVVPDFHDRQLPRYVWIPDRKAFLDLGEQPRKKPDEQKTEMPEDTARRVWEVSPVEELPKDAAVTLHVEPGLVSALGPEPGVGSRVVVQFHTFPEFRFLGVKCQTLGSTETLWAPGSPGQPCNPLSQVFLLFSSPVIADEVKKNVTFDPDLAGGRKDYDPWAKRGSYSRLSQPHRPGAEYAVALPEKLRAFHTYRLKGSPRDEFDRELADKIAFEFRTDHRAPLYRLPNRISVLENGVDSELPLYVTNMEEIRYEGRALTAGGIKPGAGRTLRPGTAPDVAFAIPLEIRKALQGVSGALYGSLSSTPPMSHDTSFLTQVTPFHVSAKYGHFNTQVWVTDMASGKPVPGAKITLYRASYADLTPGKPLAQGTTDDQGIALLPGTETIDPSLSLGRAYDDIDPRLFVRVIKGNEQGLLPLDRYFQIDAYRIGGALWPNVKTKHGHMHAWGTTAQGVYRAGDRIQYKIYVRDQNNETFVPARKGDYTLTVVDPTGKDVHAVRNLKLNAFGAHSGEFKVPATGAVGWYTFHLKASYHSHHLTPLQVLVADFTPSPFRVESALNGDLFKAGDELEVTTGAKLHSGGPYPDASVRLTALAQEKAIQPSHKVARNFYFQSGLHDYEGHHRQTFFEKTGNLDGKGEIRETVPLDEVPIVYGTVMVESAVQDDRGKSVAALASAAYRGRDRYVGLRNPKWAHDAGKKMEMEYLVIDTKGNPVAGHGVDVRVEWYETKVSRVKGSGNAYLTNFTSAWKKVGACSGKSRADGTTCAYVPQQPGSYRFTASVKDTKGRAHETTLHTYVVGKGYVAWETPDNNALEIVPEQAEYRVGDKARYLVKNPFPGGQALITVERYGVLRRWTRRFDSSTEVVEIPVEPDFLPGFYLSVMVTSPRVDKGKDLGKLDLGKPSFRAGYVTVPVRDPYKEVEVSVRADREVYRPRDKVTVTLKARPRKPAPGKPQPLELAVVVLDEAVFDLIQAGKEYYDPYRGFYNLDGLDVRNYSTLLNLIGRQKFEKKGANAGGGGGMADVAMRDLFKFVAYWNPSLKPNNKGEARIEFTVPDNLTGWKVLALAVTPGDRMGLGEGHFKVNRPTEVRPVMPNQVTEGDTFKAGVSVMNRTEAARTLDVEIKATGDIQDPPKTHRESVKLAPYQKRLVWLSLKTRAVKASRDTPRGEVRFEVRARDSADGDGLVHKVPVNKRRSLLTAANYGTTTEKKVTESVLFPKNIHPDVGSVSVTAAPTVIGNVEGAFRYLRDYPYGCWEQKLTKGVMAAHYLSLRAYLPKEFLWEEAGKLPAITLEQAANYQAPNGGMVYYIPNDAYVSPYLSAYTALAFRWLRASGHRVPEAVESRLQGYLLNLLRNEVFPTFYSDGMASTVRAVALAALAPAGKVDFGDIQRYEKHFPRMDLFGKAHYLQAALHFKEAGAIAEKSAKTILGHSNQSAGKFQFNEDLDDGYTRILSTPMRSMCAILGAFSGYAGKKEGKALVSDVPFKMVRAITQTRGARDYWENTQENMFCLNALIEYGRIYEAVKPQFTVKAFLDSKPFGQALFKDLRDKMAVFERPLDAKDPGRRAKVEITREGKGRLYYATRVRYAPTDEFSERTNAGLDIRKEYSTKQDGKWVLLGVKPKLTRGQVVRVDIFLSLPTARNFVVVDDPIPGGLEPVNAQLKTASTVDAEDGAYQAAGGSWFFKFSDWTFYAASRWSFYHQELRHDRAVFYSDYLPPGNFHVSYTAQAVATGTFSMMPLHAEEMYDPDVFGKDKADTLTVEEK